MWCERARAQTHARARSRAQSPRARAPPCGRRAFLRDHAGQAIKLVFAYEGDVALVRRLMDEVAATLPAGEGEIKVEVNPRDKSLTAFWRQLGFQGLDKIVSRPYCR